MKYPKFKQIISLITCFLLVLAVAVNKENKVLGWSLKQDKEQTQSSEGKDSVMRTADDGSTIISTQVLAKDILGYAGNVPLEIYMSDGRITKIVALPNSETPGFFKRVVKSGMLTRWDGLTAKEALNTKVDALSGATFTSNAIIQSVQRAMGYVNASAGECNTSSASVFSVKFILTLIVVLLGAILPYFIKSKRYRIVQLVLNVAILGFWSGCFLSYSLFVNYLANGVNVWISLIPLLLIVVAFIMPLFGKSSHYCTWLCPLGSIQELAGKAMPYKYSIPEKALKYLNYFREGLWAVLMLLMWTGVMFKWMDYELFTAFMFQQAAWYIIAAAIAFVALSLVVPRPYCRFVCPTGTLLRLSQQSK
ncbi:MAG: FMN-binding protein [Bacteroidales bacterium]